MWGVMTKRGCRGCRKCEGGVRNIGCMCVTLFVVCCTCGLFLLAFPFIGRCARCGHTNWLNKH